MNTFYAIGGGIQRTFTTLQFIKSHETTCKIFDVITLFFGVDGAINLTKWAFSQNNNMNTSYISFPPWKQNVCKIADLLGDVSTILSALNSRPAHFFFLWSSKHILNAVDLTQFFGQPGLFPINKISRHATTISFILGIPCAIKTIYLFYRWIRSSSSQQSSPPSSPTNNSSDPLTTPAKRSFRRFNITKEDVYLTMATVSETTKQFMHTPQKPFFR